MLFTLLWSCQHTRQQKGRVGASFHTMTAQRLARQGVHDEASHSCTIIIVPPNGSSLRLVRLAKGWWHRAHVTSAPRHPSSNQPHTRHYTIVLHNTNEIAASRRPHQAEGHASPPTSLIITYSHSQHAENHTPLTHSYHQTASHNHTCEGRAWGSLK